MDKIKVLFLAANPTNTTRLALDEEIRAITEKIRASEYRDLIELVSVWAVRADDLLQALNQHQPQIVHFSGHGEPSGEIILVDSDKAAKNVSIKAIKALFKTLKDNIRVVVLNACYSHAQANALTEVIDCVVGMNAAIGDQAAMTFAASFYRAIGFGRSVQEAFEQGQAAILLEGLSEEDTPELLTRRGLDPARIFLIKPRTPVVVGPAVRPSKQPPELLQDLLAALHKEGYTNVESPEWLDLVMLKQTMRGLVPKVVAVSIAISATAASTSLEETFARFKKWSKGLLGNNGIATLVYVYEEPPIELVERILKLGRGILGYGQVVPYVYDASTRKFWFWQPILGTQTTDKLK